MLKSQDSSPDWMDLKVSVCHHATPPPLINNRRARNPSTTQRESQAKQVRSESWSLVTVCRLFNSGHILKENSTLKKHWRHLTSCGNDMFRSRAKTETAHRVQHATGERLYKANWAIFQLLSVPISFKANLK